MWGTWKRNGSILLGRITNDAISARCLIRKLLELYGKHINFFSIFESKKKSFVWHTLLRLKIFVFVDRSGRPKGFNRFLIGIRCKWSPSGRLSSGFAYLEPVVLAACLILTFFFFFFWAFWQGPPTLRENQNQKMKLAESKSKSYRFCANPTFLPLTITSRGTGRPAWSSDLHDAMHVLLYIQCLAHAWLCAWTLLVNDTDNDADSGFGTMRKEREEKKKKKRHTKGS